MHSDSKGFTLIEIIIVMAIVGIVAAVVYSLHLFGVKTFAKGEEQSEVQYEARMAADYITREIRFATEVEMLNALPASFESNSFYFYTGIRDGKECILFWDGAEKKAAAFTTVSLSFSTEAPDKTLYFNIAGQYKGQNFSIDSKVLPLNLPKNNIILNPSAGGICVKFRKTEVTWSGSLLVQPAPPNKYINQPYQHTFVITGGTGPYTYTDHGSLPGWLRLNISTGMLSGTTPGTAGRYTFTITVTDSSMPKKVGTRTFEIMIVDPSRTASMVAAEISSLDSPEPGATSLNLPELESGFIATIFSSSNEAVISNTGSITSPEVDTDVDIVLTVYNVINESDPPANTSVFTVTVKPGAPNQTPKATNVMISGEAKVGSVLAGYYTYSDPERDPEGVTLLQWYIGSNSNVSDKIPIEGANTNNYIPVSSDIGKYIFFEVTPAAATGTAAGQSVISLPVLVSNSANSAPKVTETHYEGINLQGKASIGDTLIAKYTYYDAEGDQEFGTTINWYRKTNSNSNLVLSGSDHYVVQELDAGRLIYFEIIPRTLTGVTAGDKYITQSVEINPKSH